VNHLNISPVKPVDQLPPPYLCALNETWAAFVNACGTDYPSVFKGSEIADAAGKVFLFSRFTARRCTQDPGMLAALVETGDLTRSCDWAEAAQKIAEACQQAEDIGALSSILRKIRTREMVRIAFRDLAGWSPLPETMNDLSALADACVEGALVVLYRWMTADYGTPLGKDRNPQRLVVVGFGKLGGRELNFSSDVDLMFAFPEAGETVGGNVSLSNQEFFARLCHRLIDVIGKNINDGFVFRVDARLRPYGDAGPIAMSFEALESYYQEQGREWERYALIKTRVVAGDHEAGRLLLDRLNPFVYRRYLDYGTFDSLREMKQKIEREVTRKGMRGNIKLGPGGIREVEFFGQIFQLIRGGVNIDYQSPGILKILQVLVEDHNIPEQVSEELTVAYVFLRYVENRLQMADDRQTHSLPVDASDQFLLALSMGFNDWTEFSEALDAHMDRIHRHFHSLLVKDGGNDVMDGQTRAIFEVWNNLSDDETNLSRLAAIGFQQPEEALTVLKRFLEMIKSHEVSLQGRKRIDRLVPSVIKLAATAENPVSVLQRIFELIRSIRGRSCYVSLLIENTDALHHLARLAGASPWIISFISRHPLLLDELLDSRTLYEPLQKADLKKELAQRFARLPVTDLESRLDNLRIFKQINTLRICAADVDGLLPLMKVSDRLTYLAESILDEVLDISWDLLVQKYGLPSGASPEQKGFSIIAYGKLGGFELGYGSDIDLVFLYTGEKGNTAGGEMPPLDNAQFYVRLGQRIIHFLTAMTQTGKLYETDMRLRPSGSAGVLVTHIHSFGEYQLNQAWPWEHQALIKARTVSGDDRVGRLFASIRETILSLTRDASGLQAAISDMRERMRKERKIAGNSGFDLKNDPGGLIDIEFLVQYLILLNAHRHPALVKWTDAVRQLNSLALAGIIDDRTAYKLKQAYLVFRFYIHRLTLQEKPAMLPNSQFQDLRDEVRGVWNWYLKEEFN
jgi:glutamate-ammonia-ligase adenylyltransferase